MLRKACPHIAVIDINLVIVLAESSFVLHKRRLMYKYLTPATYIVMGLGLSSKRTCPGIISMIGNRKFRTFNVIDDCSREALCIDVDTSLSSKRIIRTLNRIGESRGFPKAIRSDNGPEFTSKDFTIWCEEKGIETRYIQPGRPTQNGYIEDLTGSTEKQY